MSALDPSLGMLKVDRSKLTSANIDWIHSDFFDFEFGPKKFDVIIESLVLEHIKDIQAFFLKVYSLLAS
ncbi:MAG: class I SAM-dependent methyltransferase [Xanthomonadaceae bacterium]|nr:class I SAM-dependent methyltransferase [Xanthomonadaceae bacterium]